MLKKYLWVTILIFGFISCEEAPNDYSPEANEFLNAIDGKEYNGKGSWSAATFQAHDTVISEHKAVGTITHPLFFQPNETTGTTATRAIYRFRMTTDPPTQGDYVGIEIANGGDLLKRTTASTTSAVNWSSAFDFATKK